MFDSSYATWRGRRTRHRPPPTRAGSPLVHIRSEPAADRGQKPPAPIPEDDAISLNARIAIYGSPEMHAALENFMGHQRRFAAKIGEMVSYREYADVDRLMAQKALETSGEAEHIRKEVRAAAREVERVAASELRPRD